MLAYLSGVVKERNKGEMIITVSAGGDDAGCVGYLIKTPDHIRYEKFTPGLRAEVYLYTHVREDALDLYGFLNATEKNFFMTLLSVSGVGPKMALSLLSFTDAPSLIQMILDEDKDALTGISGVGKKTAERIILELKDTIRKKIDSNILTLTKSTPLGGASVDRSTSLFAESYLALQALGYKETHAKQMIEKVLSEKKLTKVEEVIKHALQASI